MEKRQGQDLDVFIFGGPGEGEEVGVKMHLWMDDFGK